MTDSALEKAIAYVAPAWAARRMMARRAMEFSASVYPGASQGRTDTYYNRSMSLTGLRPIRRWELIRLRDRSRQLDRSNLMAAGMLDRAVDNVIGKGMTLEPRTPDADFNAEVKELWKASCDQLDVRGLSSFGDLQRLMFRSHLRDGDVGAILMSRAGVPFIQPIEGDYIDSLEGSGLDTPTSVHGVEIDQYSRPTGFHVVSYDTNGARKPVFVPAKDFVFMPRLKAFSDVRGEPIFSSMFGIFDQVDGVIEATTMAVRMAACFGIVVKTMAPATNFGALPQQMNSQGLQQRQATLEPGLIQYLQSNEDISQVTPQQPTQNLPDFIAMLMRFAGLNLGLPLELVMLDFSRTNYSSARAALLQAYRTFRVMQQRFIDQFLNRVYRWWLEKQVARGLLKIPAALKDSYTKHQWIAPGWAWVDPTKEIEAALMEVDAGLNTLTNIAAAHGEDFLTLLQARKHEIEAQKAAGVPIVRSMQTRDPGAPGAALPGQPPANNPPAEDKPEGAPDDAEIQEDE